MANFIELQSNGKIHLINIEYIVAIIITPPTSEYVRVGELTEFGYVTKTERVDATREVIDVYLRGESGPISLTGQIASPLLEIIKKQFTIHP